jgi:hypothetical protein
MIGGPGHQQQRCAGPPPSRYPSFRSRTSRRPGALSAVIAATHEVGRGEPASTFALSAPTARRVPAAGPHMSILTSRRIWAELRAQSSASEWNGAGEACAPAWRAEVVAPISDSPGRESAQRASAGDAPDLRFGRTQTFAIWADVSGVGDGGITTPNAGIAQPIALYL